MKLCLILLLRHAVQLTVMHLQYNKNYSYCVGANCLDGKKNAVSLLDLLFSLECKASVNTRVLTSTIPVQFGLFIQGQIHI